MMVLLLCFMATAFTIINLLHLTFGGVEGLPILLTLVLTHSPAPCLSTALALCIHRILLVSRLPWPFAASTLGYVSAVLTLSSIAGDVTVAITQSTPLLLTWRVTLTALALLPVLFYIFRYAKIREVAKILRREHNDELKLMIYPPRDSLAFEQNIARTLLKDVLPKWSALLLTCALFSIIMWGCNLSISVFYSVSRVPFLYWWVVHTLNIIVQVLVIIFVILSCVVTHENQEINLIHRMFVVPKDVFGRTASPTLITGVPNGPRNMIYERVSNVVPNHDMYAPTLIHSNTNETYASSMMIQGPMVTSGPNDNYGTVRSVHMSSGMYGPRPRVNLHRSKTFNCADAPVMMMPGSVPVHRRVHPNVPSPYGYPVNSVPPPEGVQYMMVDPNSQQYPMPQYTSQTAVDASGGMGPNVNIEYNSLRRFPRSYQRNLRMNANMMRPNFNPPEIRETSGNYVVRTPLSSLGSAPVSPYHSGGQFTQINSGSPYGPASVSSFQSHIRPPNLNSQQRQPPSLPSRNGSFRSHYSPLKPNGSACSPYPSPHQNQTMREDPYPRHVLGPPPPPPLDHFQTQTSSYPASPTESKSLYDHYGMVSMTPNSEMSTSGYLTQNSGVSNCGPAQYRPNEESTETLSRSHNYDHKNSAYSPDECQGELQIHPEKSLEATVREILSSGEKPLIKPRKRSSRDSSRISHVDVASAGNQLGFRENYIPNGVECSPNFPENGLDKSASKTASSTACILSENLDISLEGTDNDGGKPSNLKRNNSVAGCYYPQHLTKNNVEAEEDVNKYSSFRLSHHRNKPNWYGTWGGRKKSKLGAPYSVDTPIEERNHQQQQERISGDKKLSASRASLASISSKFKSLRKDKVNVFFLCRSYAICFFNV